MTIFGCAAASCFPSMVGSSDRAQKSFAIYLAYTLLRVVDDCHTKKPSTRTPDEVGVGIYVGTIFFCGTPGTQKLAFKLIAEHPQTEKPIAPMASPTCKNTFFEAIMFSSVSEKLYLF